MRTLTMLTVARRAAEALPGDPVRAEAVPAPSAGTSPGASGRYMGPDGFRARRSAQTEDGR